VGGGRPCSSSRCSRVVDECVPACVVELCVLELAMWWTVQTEPLELLLQVVRVLWYVGLLVYRGGAAGVILLVKIQPGATRGGECYRGQGRVGV